MTEIFREVDEEVRRDQYLNLWKKYGPWLIAGVVALILGVAGYQAWQYFSRQAHEAETAALIDAIKPLETGDYQAAIEALKATEAEVSGTMAALARFREAEARLRIDDRTGAVAVLENIAGDDSVDRMYRDLAVVKSVMLQLRELSVDDVVARLDPIAKQGNPWRFSATELQGLAAMTEGRTEFARAQFESLAANAEAPGRFRSRARALAAFLDGSGAAEPAADAKSSATPGTAE